MTIPPPRESELVSAILELAAAHRHLIRLIRTPAGTVGGRMVPGRGFVQTERETSAEEGWPDLTGYVPRGLPRRSGKCVLVECKRARGFTEAERLLTDEQRENLIALVAAGGVGILAWDATQFWSEYLEAVGMVERGGLIVPAVKQAGTWRPCECERRLRGGSLSVSDKPITDAPREGHAAGCAIWRRATYTRDTPAPACTCGFEEPAP